MTTGTPFTVRTPVPEDAPGIARVHTQSWRETYTGLVPERFFDDDATLLIARFRSAVLAVRDGADVVSVAHALDPSGMQPTPLLTAALTRAGMDPAPAETAALTLVRFTLGSVTVQQTRESMDLPTATMAAEFEAGVRAILA